MSTPAYIVDRLRQTAPSGCGVIAGTTPVVSFGEASKARVATLGLNPSRREFYESGKELGGNARRFETLNSLGLASIAEATPEHIERITHRCASYFHGNPYMDWFGDLENVLAEIGASYHDGSACHLDLSQWATDPTWGGLPAHARRTLMTTDAPFLRQQLEQENIKLLLINGSGVTEGFCRALGVELTEYTCVSDRSVTTKILDGHLGGIEVIAWSTNLQSAYGVTRRLRAKLTEAVGQLALAIEIGRPRRYGHYLVADLLDSDGLPLPPTGYAS